MPSPAPTPPGSARSFSLAIAGSGGAGVMTAGTLLLDAGAAHRLVGRGQRIGHDVHLGQSQPGLGQALLVDRAQPARRHPRSPRGR